MFAESGNTFTESALDREAETEAAARSVKAAPTHLILQTSFIMTLTLSHNGLPLLSSLISPNP